jgi:hypothetical protein
MDDAAPPAERTTRFAVLTAVTVVVTTALLLWRGHLLVSPWFLAALGIPWLGFSIVLRIRRRDWGAEGKYLDLWSIPHVIAGALFGLLDIGLVPVFVVAVAWECVEAVSQVFEHFTNRVTDVVIALVGWAAAQLVLTGSLSIS